MSWSSFRDIEAWQDARVLNRAIWGLVATLQARKDYALADQINRAAGSTMDNIAEGFDSGSNAEFVRFLRYAQRSCSEVHSQLFRALDRNHLDQRQFDELWEMTDKVRAKTGGIIKRLT